MSQQDSSEPGDWDSELDDVDLCCSSPSSSVYSAGGLGSNLLQAQEGSAGTVLRTSDPEPATSLSGAAESGSSGTTSASATAPASRSNSYSGKQPSAQPAGPRLNPGQGGPLFSLALADLNGCSSSSGTQPNLKQIAKLHAADTSAAAAQAPSEVSSHSKVASQQQQQQQQQQHKQGVQQQPQAQAQAQVQAPVRPPGTRIPSMSLRLPAGHQNSSSSTPTSDVAAAASAAATAALQPLQTRLPSPTAAMRPTGGNSSSTQDLQLNSPGGRRNRNSHHIQGSVPHGSTQNPGRSKPPPLALFNTAASSPAGSPHAYSAAATAAAAGAARLGFGTLAAPAAAAAAGGGGGGGSWAGIRGSAEPGPTLRGHGSHAEHQHQLVKVQLLLPALEVYLPLTADAAAAAVRSSAQQQPGHAEGPESPLHRQRSAAVKLQRSNSGGSSSNSRSNSRGRSRGGSLEGASGPQAGPEAPSVLQGGQHSSNSSSTAAAAGVLQRAISRALGVDASHLDFYAAQQVQLQELLQQQQQFPAQQQQQPLASPQMMLPLPPARLQQQQQQKLQRSSSSSSGDGSRPRSRGPSPLRGSSGGVAAAAGTSSGGGGAGGGRSMLSLSLPQQQQQQQQAVCQPELSVVVGFRDSSCSFSLGKLEELLQGAAAQADAAEELRHVNKELQVGHRLFELWLHGPGWNLHGGG